MKTALALDLGTHTGWALLRDGLVTAGTWILATPKEVTAARKLRLDRKCDPRFSRLCQHLMDTCRQVDIIVFEDILFGSTTGQCHLWATWRAAVWAMADRDIVMDCLNSSSLKKFATGNGGATKEQMARALTMNPRWELHPRGVRDLKTGETLDENAIDALHLLAWTQQTFPSLTSPSK